MKTKYGAAVAPVFVLAGAYVAWSYINRNLWRKKNDNNGHDIRKSIGKNSVEPKRNNNVKNTGKEGSSGRRRRDERTMSRSVSMGAIRGGKLALQRLLDLHSYRFDTSSLANDEAEFKSLLLKENPDFGLRDIVKMEMSGKEAKGVDILKKALKKAREEGKGHEDVACGNVDLLGKLGRGFKM